MDKKKRVFLAISYSYVLLGVLTSSPTIHELIGELPTCIASVLFLSIWLLFLPIWLTRLVFMFVIGLELASIATIILFSICIIPVDRLLNRLCLQMPVFVAYCLIVLMIEWAIIVKYIGFRIGPGD